MEFTVNSFGGVLVTAAGGNFAVNGGGSLEEMEKAYLQPGARLTALILTSEYLERSRNAVLFAQKHHIPILTSFITYCKMRIHGIPMIYCFPPVLINLYGVKIGIYHLRYDSIDPFFLTIEDKEKIGIVIDGKLGRESAEKLMDCSRILLCNEFELHDSMSQPLRRRIHSLYNSREELEDLFREYGGEIIKIRRRLRSDPSAGNGEIQRTANSG